MAAQWALLPAGMVLLAQSAETAPAPTQCAPARPPGRCRTVPPESRETPLIEYPFIGVRGEQCNASTKQKALYVEYTVSPSLEDAPATDLTVSTIWRNVSAMRKWGRNGVFAAHPFHTGGPSGYFGTQADGDPANGGLLFSIWDSAIARGASRGCTASGYPNASWCNHLHSFPLSSNCHRHCLDCGLHPGWRNTTGTQCGINFTFQDGDHVLLRLTQTKRNTRLFDKPIVYSGAIWSLTANITRGGATLAAINVGTVFLQETYTGVARLGAFHEHIGCTPCGAFYESEWRSGVDVLQPYPRPTLNISFSPPAGKSCQLFRVTTENNKSPRVLIETGPGT